MPEPTKDQQSFFGFYLDAEDAWLSPKEAGQLLGGMSEDFIRSAYESGQIPGFSFNSRPAKEGCPAERERYKRYIIPKSGLILYAAENANFSPDELLRRLREITSRLPADLQARLANELQQQLRTA